MRAEVESEILSDEAVARAQKAFQAELSRYATRDKAEPPVTQKLAKDALQSPTSERATVRRLSTPPGDRLKPLLRSSRHPLWPA
jgi:hypothetical protein